MAVWPRSLDPPVAAAQQVAAQSLQVAAPTRASGAALPRALRRRAPTVARAPSMAVFGPGPSTNRPIDAEDDDGDDVASDDSEICFGPTVGGTRFGDDDFGMAAARRITKKGKPQV